MVTLKKQFVCFFLLCSYWLFGQSTIKGVVVSTDGKFVNQATVYIKDATDTSLAYDITRNNGEFSITIKSKGSYFIKISSLEYKTYQQPIIISEKLIDLGEIVLQPDNIELKEVIIQNDKNGMTEIGDTLRYKIERFLNGTEETLGDIIKKMPGLDVDKNGKIKANGRQIDKLLIDGQEFFTDQEKLATENITANMIKNLELIKNYKEFKNIDKNKETGLTALNVNIKEQFKNKFTGNVEAGFGNKYKMHASLFNFRKRMLLSYISDSNNTGELSITLEDYDNFINKKEEEIAGEVEYASLENFPRFLRLGNNVKKRLNGFNGLNVKYIPLNNFQINSYFIYNKVNQMESELNQQNYFTNTTPFINNEHKENEEQTNFITGLVNATFKLKENAVVDYNLTFNSLLKDLDASIDTETNQFNEKTKDNDYEINHAFSFVKNLKDNRKFHFVFRQNLAEKHQNLTIKSDNPFLDLLFSNSDFQVNQITKDRKNNLALNSSYGFLFKKVNLSLSSDFSIVTNKIGNYENQFTQFNNAIDFKIKTQSVGLESRFKIIDKTIFTSKVNFTNASLNFNQFSDNKKLWSSSLALKTTFNTNHTLKLSFTKNNNFTAAENLLVNQQIKDYLTIYNNENVSFNTISPNNRVAVDYFNASVKSNFTLISSVSLFDAKNIVSYNAVSSSTVSQLNYRLSPEEKNLTSFIFAEKTFKKVPFTFKSSFSFLENKTVSYIDNIQVKFKTQTFEYYYSMLSRIKKTSFQFELGGQYATSLFFNTTLGNTSSFTNIFLETSFKISKNISFINKLSFNKFESADLQNNLFIVSPRVRYSIPKSKFEISISGNNVLNLKNTEQVTVTQNTNYIQQKVSKIISGYILLNFKVKL